MSRRRNDILMPVIAVVITVALSVTSSWWIGEVFKVDGPKEAKLEQRTLELINEAREEAELEPLGWDRSLGKLADERSQQAVVDSDRAAGPSQRSGNGVSAACGAPAIDQHLHPHPPAGCLSQHLDKVRAHTRRCEGIHLQVDTPLRLLDGQEHARIGLITSVEQHHRLGL